MSITQETLQHYLKDHAIFCCRREKGLVISASNLEDLVLFDDMQEAGLLTLSPNGLLIEQVIGSTLLHDVEALTPITRDVLDKVNEVKTAKEDVSEVSHEMKGAPEIQSRVGGNGMIHIEIGKAEKFEGLKIDVPVFAGAAPAEVAEKSGEKKVIHNLVKKHIKITDVKLGEETSIKDG